MIQKVHQRQVNYEYQVDESSQVFGLLDSGNIITRFNSLTKNCQIFTYDQESKSYKKFSFFTHCTFKKCEILVNNYLLIFFDQYVKLTIFHIANQSIQVDSNGLTPHCYYYRNEFQIYQLRERVMKVFDYSQYPQVKEFKFQYYIKKIEIIALLKQSLMKVTYRRCKKYYLLPLHQGYAAVDVHHPQMRLMHLRFFMYHGANDQIIKVKIENYIISKTRSSRYSFYNQHFLLIEVKLFNKFLYLEHNHQHIQLFQMRPKQKIIRMFAKGIFKNDFKLIKDQYIIGRLPRWPCTHYVQDILTAKQTAFDFSDYNLITDTTIMDIKPKSLSISTYEIITEQ